jgi:glycosyltransferase involved in cell wall biosynthesis
MPSILGRSDATGWDVVCGTGRRDCEAVSVVIPAYNSGSYIVETLDSVIKQSLGGVEIIVVDDGSQDNTEEAVASFACRGRSARLKYVKLPESRGVSHARNCGLSLVRSPFVVFLDADDLLTPLALECMVQALQREPGRIACYGNYIRIREDGRCIEARPSAMRKLPESNTLWNLLGNNFIPTGSLCVRTSVANAVGGYNENLRFGEDWEFWCRLASLGDFTAVDATLMKYRQRSSGASRCLAGTPHSPNTAAIEAIYSNPAVIGRFPSRELRERRRKAEMDAYWAAALGRIRTRDLTSICASLLAGLIRYPDVLLRPRKIYLYGRRMVQRIWLEAGGMERLS